MTNRNLFYFFVSIILTISFTSCSTIIGGSKYNAKVLVIDHPQAKIEYNGEYQGTGVANFKVKRKDANKFSVTIKEEGCESETINFTQRTFRGWAFFGTLIGWTGLTINGGPWLPIPFGVIVDGAAGSWWKPDVNEKGIKKIDYKNFNYNIEYSGCKNKINNLNDKVQPSIEEKLKELKKLLDDGTLTKEEFEKAKSKLLN